MCVSNRLDCFKFIITFQLFISRFSRVSQYLKFYVNRLIVENFNAHLHNIYVGKLCFNILYSFCFKNNTITKMEKSRY